MSILTKTVETIKSKDVLQHEVSKKITTETQRIYTDLILRYNAVMNEFWNHPVLTPQDVSDSMGTDAASLFQYGGALSTLILTINPSESRLVLPKNAFTIHSDGKVTILDTPYIPQ